MTESGGAPLVQFWLCWLRYGAESSGCVKGVGIRRLRTSHAFGLLAVAGFIVASALEDNLRRLHGPTAQRRGYRSLFSGDRIEEARITWDEALEQLAPFGPRSAETLIRWHVVSDSTFVLATVAGLAFAISVSAGVSLTGRVRALLARYPLICLALTLDLLGNGTELINSWMWNRWLAWLAGGLWTMAMVAYVASVVWGAWRFKSRLGNAAAAVWYSPAFIRVLLVMDFGLVVLVFLGKIGVQSEDLLERWFTGSPGSVLAVTATYALVVALVWSSRLLRPKNGSGPGARALIAITLILVVGGAWLRFGFGWGYGSLTLGVLALVALLGSVSGGGADAVAEQDVPWVRGVGAAFPAAVLSIVALRAGANALAVDERLADDGKLLIAGLLGLGLAHLGYHVAAQPARPGSSQPSWIAPLLLTVALALTLVTLTLARWSDGMQAVGSFAVVLFGMVTAVAIGAATRAIMSSANTPSFFRKFRVPLLLIGWPIRRTPIILLMTLWILVASALNGRTNLGTNPIRYYDARTVERVTDLPVAADARCQAATGTSAAAPAVVRSLCRWLSAVPADAETPIPLILATASGGGVRAAAWTSTVLDCVLFRRDIASCEGETNVDRFGYLFAANGASGGSVGIASVVAERLVRPSGEPVPEDWVAEALSADFLAPTIGHAIAYDGLLGMFGINPGHDRTWTLEETWAERWQHPAEFCQDPSSGLDSVGLLNLTASCAVPLMLFNGTDVDSGCRVNIAPIDVDLGLPGDESTSIDLVDSLDATDDVPLFTAAFLSARFPVVTSAGRIEGGDPTRVLNIVDGGYGENSGTSQMAELWQQLEPLIDAHNRANPDREVRPVLIEISNGEQTEPATGQSSSEIYGGTSLVCRRGRSHVGELWRPVEAYRARDVARERGLRNRLVESIVAFTTPSGHRGFHATITMYEHPGRSFPLGWTLSPNTLDDLDDQLMVEQNRETLSDLETVVIVI